MHVKEIYVIFIHVFDSGILLIIELNKKKGKNRESIRDATAELQVKFIWSNWIPVFKIYQCYVSLHDPLPKLCSVCLGPKKGPRGGLK
jgi:hypothetical protein